MSHSAELPLTEAQQRLVQAIAERERIAKAIVGAVQVTVRKDEEMHND